jgi:hypothetical protein
MVAKGVVATTNIAWIVKHVDARKMMKSQYEVTINLFLLVAFVAFVVILYYPTIDKE